MAPTMNDSRPSPIPAPDSDSVPAPNPHATHFLERFSARNHKTFKGISPAAQQKLLAYHWPGNVRELENCIERAVVMAQGEILGADDIALNPVISRESPGDVAARLIQPGFSIEDFERTLLEASLRKTGGNQSRAAELLGLTRRTLQYRMEKYNIQINRAPATDADQPSPE